MQLNLLLYQKHIKTRLSRSRKYLKSFRLMVTLSQVGMLSRSYALLADDFLVVEADENELLEDLG